MSLLLPSIGPLLVELHREGTARGRARAKRVWALCRIERIRRVNCRTLQRGGEDSAAVSVRSGRGYAEPGQAGGLRGGDVPDTALRCGRVQLPVVVGGRDARGRVLCDGYSRYC